MLPGRERLKVPSDCSPVGPICTNFPSMVRKQLKYEVILARASCWAGVNLELGLAANPGVAGTAGFVTAAGVEGRTAGGWPVDPGRRRGEGTFPGTAAPGGLDAAVWAPAGGAAKA